MRLGSVRPSNPRTLTARQGGPPTTAQDITSEPAPAVQPSRRERVKVPRSCHSKWRQRVAELGERLGAKVVSHPLPDRSGDNAAADVCRHPLADRRLRAPPSPAGAALGVRCEATREEVCLYGAKAARSVPERCQVGGSTACPARRALSRLAEDAYRRDPGLTTAGISGGCRFNSASRYCRPACGLRFCRQEW